MSEVEIKRFKDLDGPKSRFLVGNTFDLTISDLHNQLAGWADEYGGMYRLNMAVTKLTIISDPVMNNAILKERPELFRRAPKMDRIIRESGVHGLFNAEGEVWKKQRKVITKGLDVRHQKSFFDAIRTSLERLHKKWMTDIEEDRITDIQSDFLRFTVDVSTSLAFGIDMNTIEEKGGVIQDHLEKVFPVIFKRINTPFPFYKFYKTKEDKAFERAVSEVEKFVDKIVLEGRERIEKNPALRKNPTNLLESIIVASEEEDSALTDLEVRGNLVIILLAGEDTTGHTLAWSTVLLDGLPKVIDEIRNEADVVLGNQSFMKDYELNTAFKYIEAVAYETMRLKPVAPLLLHDTLEETIIEGYQFNKGEKILNLLNHSAANEENFTNAKTFNPDRWLSRSKCPMHNVDASIPFGAGPRYCPGRNLAILEIKAVLSMLYKNFNVEVLDKEKIHDIMAFTMMPSEFKVKLSRRNG